MYLNERIGDYKLTGKVTCRNANIVNYCISSSEILKYFSNFTVLDFCKLFSDVHCSLKVSLTGSTCNLTITGSTCKLTINKHESENQTMNNFQSTGKIKKWENEKCLDFQKKIKSR